jgi:hypothetical protein
MKKVTLLVAALLVVALAGTGCKKKEPPPPPMPPQGAPGAPGAPGMPGAPHGEGGPPVEKKVVVPDAIRSAWKAVKVEVEFKDKKTRKQYTVALNSEFKVPDSDLTLKVGGFLPHFTMTADQITSGSNNLENPAAQIEVFQGGKEIFHGWLFSKYPAVHPFQHDKYGLALVDGIKK